MGKELVKVANQNPEFKRVVEEECLKQVKGDYNVGVDKILQISEQKQLLSVDDKNNMKELLKQMVTLKPGRLPLIFVPVVEIYDPQADIYKGITFSSRYESTNKHSNITVVSQDAQVTKGDLYPGYRFNSSGQWDTCGLISEDFA